MFRVDGGPPPKRNDEDNYSQVPRDNRSMKFYSVVMVIKTFLDNMAYRVPKHQELSSQTINTTKQPTANIEHAIKAFSAR